MEKKRKCDVSTEATKGINIFLELQIPSIEI